MNGYLIPANAKKGTLIFNVFRPFDLWLFGIGIAVSLLLLMIVPTTSIVMVLIALLPGCTCGLLVFPIPNYHNVLCALGSIYRFYYGSYREYHWKGWCFNERFSEKNSRK